MMPDKEKVIKGLGMCQNASKTCCNGCPYLGDGWIGECTADLATDALALVKKSDGKTQGDWIAHLNKHGKDRYECSFCHIRSALVTPYCSWCGTEMERVIASVE